MLNMLNTYLQLNAFLVRTDKQIGELVKEFAPQSPEFSVVSNANSTQTFSSKSASHVTNNTHLELNSTLAYKNSTNAIYSNSSLNSSVVLFSNTNTTSLNSNIPSSTANFLIGNKQFIFMFNLFSFMILFKKF